MNAKNPVEDLKEIRSMMEKSTKFLSLSGLSGVVAGLTALGGVWFAKTLLIDFQKKYMFYQLNGTYNQKLIALERNLMLSAIGILIIALGAGVFFTWQKAKKQNQKIFTPLGFRLGFSLLIPLVFAGVFVIALYYRNYILLIGPVMLIFYGMALLNASKYVHTEIKYLALMEMVLGVIAVFDLGHGLRYWAIGFGVLHILYGTIMYFKYDFKQ